MSKELIDHVIELVKEALGSHVFNMNVESQVKAKAYAKLEELLKSAPKEIDNLVSKVKELPKNIESSIKGKTKQ